MKKIFAVFIIGTLSITAQASIPEQCKNLATLNMKLLYKIRHKTESDHKLEIAEQRADFAVDSRFSNYRLRFEHCIQRQYPVSPLNKIQEQDLYKILSDVIFFSPNQDTIALYQRLLASSTFDAIREQGTQRLHKATITARLLEHAENLRLENPSQALEAIPPVLISLTGDRNLLRLKDAGKSLEQTQLVLGEGVKMVVVSSPFCGPSNRLLDWINSQPELRNKLAEQSTWIIPPEGSFYTDETWQARSRFPSPPGYVLNKSEWPEISYWGTPSLYFYRDGRLIGQLVGFPKSDAAQSVFRERFFTLLKP